MIELALTILAAFAMVSAAFNPVPEAQQGARTPLLDDESLAAVAHRGCWQNAPENSIAALRSCEVRGIRIVEIDVRLTKDGIPVLMHDGTVDRTTTGTGPVSDLTLLQLQQLALLNRDGSDPSDVTDEAIPTLADVLELATAETVLNLDVKEDIHEQVWSVVDRYGQDNRLILKSRQPEDLLLYSGRAQNGNVFLMPVIEECTDRMRGRRPCGKTVASRLAAFADVHYSAVELIYTNDSFLDEFVGSGADDERPIWVNTLGPTLAAGKVDEAALADPDAVWGDLIDRGVEIIQTDYPDVLQAYLRENPAFRDLRGRK